MNIQQEHPPSGRVDSRGNMFVMCDGCSRSFRHEDSRFIADTGYMCKGCLGEEEPDETE